jgi:baculoviral IAP repeat-containing protein 6
MKVLITGQKGTPYSGGCFAFDMLLPENYPEVPPKMHFLTTGGNTFRFNPNLYENGKVCLSLLNTWAGEQWSPSVSNLTQLLISVLTMIFVPDPFFNEPGNDVYKKDDPQNIEYNKTIREGTLKHAIHVPEFYGIVQKHFTLMYKVFCEEYPESAPVFEPFAPDST